MQHATITNWSVVGLWGNCRLRGKISGHPSLRDTREGENGTTSQLKSIDFERGIAITQNTIYELK